MTDGRDGVMDRVLNHAPQEIAPDPAKPWPILCAWCQDEGVRKIIGWSEGEGSHGICDPCNQRWLQKYITQRRMENEREAVQEL